MGNHSAVSAVDVTYRGDMLFWYHKKMHGRAGTYVIKSFYKVILINGV
jgi:hypothetical protein